MSHGDTVINGDGIELSGITAHLLDFLADDLSYLMQMRMTRHKLGKRVDNGDNRFAELFLFHSCSNPERTRSSHSPTFCAYRTA